MQESQAASALLIVIFNTIAYVRVLHIHVYWFMPQKCVSLAAHTNSHT